jgi:hypothetical protein
MGNREGRYVALILLTAAAVCICWIIAYRILFNTPETGSDSSPYWLSPDGHTQGSVDHKTVDFNIFHNRDVEESHYHIYIPRDWIVSTKGILSGGLIVSSPKVKGVVELTEIPDGLSLIDYILKIDEPRIGKTAPGYEREDLRGLTIDDSPAYQLIYLSKHNGIPYYAYRSYIGGRSRECVITLLCKGVDRAEASPYVEATVMSFRWDER